jgi:hypothetical protein
MVLERALRKGHLPPTDDVASHHATLSDPIYNIHTGPAASSHLDLGGPRFGLQVVADVVVVVVMALVAVVVVMVVAVRVATAVVVVWCGDGGGDG